MKYLNKRWSQFWSMLVCLLWLAGCGTVRSVDNRKNEKGSEQPEYTTLYISELKYYDDQCNHYDSKITDTRGTLSVEGYTPEQVITKSIKQEDQDGVTRYYGSNEVLDKALFTDAGFSDEYMNLTVNSVKAGWWSDGTADSNRFSRYFSPWDAYHNGNSVSPTNNNFDNDYVHDQYCVLAASEHKVANLIEYIYKVPKNSEIKVVYESSQNQNGLGYRDEEYNYQNDISSYRVIKNDNLSDAVAEDYNKESFNVDIKMDGNVTMNILTNY